MTGDHASRRTIEVRYDLSASPERVWSTLTEPALLERWLMPNDISPIVGHRFTFRTTPAPGFDGVVQCEVLEAKPPEVLAYSWRGGRLDTIVAWKLNRTSAGGTRLLLAQDGFGPEEGYTYDMLDKGWREKAAASLRRVIDSVG